MWINNFDGMFIYLNLLEGIENVKVREWFIKVMVGYIYVFGVYILVIIRNYCIIIFMFVYDSFGKFLGVIGVDIKFLL